MKLNIVSWNGTTDINNGTDYESWYELKQQFVPTRQAIYAERPEKWQKLSGARFDEHSFMFKVRCLGTIHSQRETVKGWFDSEDFDAHNLVFEDTANSNKQWYLQGIPTKIFEESPGILSVTLATDEPYLREVTTTTDTWSITTNSDTTDYTNNGNMDAKPVFRFTPTSAKTGDFGYSRWVSVYNPGSRGMPNYPLDFCGLDTQAIVTAGKATSDGTDFILEIDGNTADSWFGTSDGRAFDTTNTAVWGIIDLAPKVEMTLKSAMTTDTTTVNLVYATAADRDSIIKAKNSANKVLLIGTEAMTYDTTSVHFSAAGAYLESVTRGAKGTTIATHAANSTVRFLEHDCWLLYDSTDYTSASTDYYTVDDDNKPMFDLHSTNTSWIYTAFRQAGKARPGSWIPQRLVDGTGNKCRFYTGYHTANANPVTYAGMKIAAYQNVTWRGDYGRIAWILSHPGGITKVEAAGEKYLYSYAGALFPATAALQYQDANTLQWETADNQSIPSTSLTWTAFTINDTDTGAFGETSYLIRYILDGSVSGAANNYAAYEISGCTLGLNSATIPQVTVGAEQSRYLLTARITNVTTGEWIRIRAVAALDRTVIVDCENKTVTYDDGTNLRAGLTLSTPRSEWLNLQPGSNTLRYNEAAVTGMTLGVEYTQRNTL